MEEPDFTNNLAKMDLTRKKDHIKYVKISLFRLIREQKSTVALVFITIFHFLPTLGFSHFNR